MRCFVAAKSDKCSKKDINTVLCGRTFSGSLIPFTGISVEGIKIFNQ